MTNSKIIRELENNQKGHIIFDHQKASDLNELKKILEEENKIVIDFSSEEWDIAFHCIVTDNYCQRVDYHYQIILETRKYIATKILVELEKKYPQLKEYGASQDIKYFTQGNRTLYKEKPHAMSIEDLEEIMTIEGIEVDRIHIIMNQIDSSYIRAALSILLSDNTPFSVTFYSSPFKCMPFEIPDKEKTTIYDVYNFTRYDEYEEGKKNIVNKKIK